MSDVASILLNGSIAEIVALYRNRVVSVQDAVIWYLERIASHQHLNAVREISRFAIEEAVTADKELGRGLIRSPLHGVPVLIKDNVFVHGMRASAGSLALRDFEPDKDAELVSRLRAAGAIVLGKTNLTEFADYVSDVMPSEFSGAGGVVHNPHGMRYGRGQGSSVGSAAAVAASLAPFCIGSETQNSIQGPAGYSSVVGYKPSVGLISTAGIVPLAPSQDTAGIIARHAADAAVVAHILAGTGIYDGPTVNLGGGRRRQYNDAEKLRQLRIGVPRKQFASRAEYAEGLLPFEEAIDKLAATGAVIIDPCDLPSAEQILEVRSSVLRTEFKAALNSMLHNCGAPCGMGSLADIITWNKANPAAVPYGQSLLVAAQETGGREEGTYKADRARDITLSLHSGIIAALKTGGVEYLIAPMDSAAKCTGKAGAPVLTIPAGKQRSGAPFGLSLFGVPGCDAELLAAGILIEKVIGASLVPGSNFSGVSRN